MKDKVEEITGTQKEFVAPEFERVAARSVLPGERPSTGMGLGGARPKTGGLGGNLLKQDPADLSKFLEGVGQRVENFSNQSSLLN